MSELHSLTQNDWLGSSVFVTGGTGFVGSHLVEQLLAAGCTDVRCLVRTDDKWLKGLPVTRIEGTLSDPDVLRQGLKDVDYVFHVAALTRSVRWDDFLYANVRGTENLLLAAAAETGIKRIVLVSSLAAVGISSQVIANEETALRPVSMYGRSKAEMETMAARYDLPITVVRPPAVYGPRETDIFTFFKTVSSGLCPVVGSPANPAISLVHVDDLVIGIMQSARSSEAAKRTFFLGGREQYAWGQIRDAASRALDRRVLTLPIPRAIVPLVGSVSEGVGKLFGFYPPLNREKANEIVNATLMCDSSLAQQTFGYAPAKELVTGVDETIRWYRDQNWIKP